MMVIDQDSTQVTATFPLGTIPLSGEVTGPGDGLIYVGGSVPSVVSTKLNRVVGNVDGLGNFTACALARNHLYGGPIAYAVGVYNLTTGVFSDLPPPVQPGPGESVNQTYGSSPPDGKTYWSPYAVTNGYTVVSGVGIYSTATNTVLAAISLPPDIYYLAPAFSRDSSTAYIAGPGVIAVYNATTFQSIATFSYPTTFTSLAISPDGSIIYATDQKAVYVLDAANGAQKQTIALPAQVGAMALSPDGTTLFLTDLSSSSVDLISTASGQLTVVPVPYPPGSVVVVP